MRSISRRIFSVCLALSFAFAAALARGQSAPISADDAKAMRAAVEGQLAAFAADDAKRAFSYAAPSIREMFGTPDRFMEMVRSGYPAVYRPASVIYLVPLRSQGQAFQGVQITDSEGGLWLATYRLEREADGSWRISGCDVQPSSGKMT